MFITSLSVHYVFVVRVDVPTQPKLADSIESNREREDFCDELRQALLDEANLKLNLSLLLMANLKPFLFQMSMQGR